MNRSSIHDNCSLSLAHCIVIIACLHIRSSDKLLRRCMKRFARFDSEPLSENPHRNLNRRWVLRDIYYMCNTCKPSDSQVLTRLKI